VATILIIILLFGIIFLWLAPEPKRSGASEDRIMIIEN